MAPKTKVFSDRNFKIFLGLVTLVWFFLYAQTAGIGLQGTHQWRQADTLFTGYFVCTENADLFHTKIGPRQNTKGVAIGEFPFFSWTAGQWCKAKGSWDELSPKIINFLFYFLAIFFWWLFLKNHFQLKNLKFYHWFALCFFSTISLSFLTIPMPEATALFFFGLAGYVWSRHQRLANAGGFLAFSFGFLLRPYHIPFLVLFKPTRKYFALTLAVCFLLFGLWYVYWPKQVNDLFGYYGIGFEGFKTLLPALPGALAILPMRLLEHTHFIGLLLFPLVFRKDRLLLALYFGSILMMLILKATHLKNHAYYLMNAAVLALVIMAYGLDMVSQTKRNVFLVLFVLIGIANTIHNIRPNKTSLDEQQLTALAAGIPMNAKVAAYTGASPIVLYWLKRTGWNLEPSSFQGEASCPSGADYYLTEEENSNYKLGKCIYAQP